MCFTDVTERKQRHAVCWNKLYLKIVKYVCQPFKCFYGENLLTVHKITRQVLVFCKILFMP